MVCLIQVEYIIYFILCFRHLMFLCVWCPCLLYFKHIACVGSGLSFKRNYYLIFYHHVICSPSYFFYTPLVLSNTINILSTSLYVILFIFF